MKIQDFHTKICSHLSINQSDLQYCNNLELGDFAIHTSKINKDIWFEKTGAKIIKEDTTMYFKLDRMKFANNVLLSILYENDKYGSRLPEKEQLYVLDYSSPNIAKKFHPGHLRTTILGSFITNLLQTRGIKTHAINYLGDWGKQFGLLGVGFKKYGNEEEMKKDAIKHLFDVYVKANQDNCDEEAKQWFVDLENGNEENYDLWKRFRLLSIEKYKQLYKILNCRFDEYSGESVYATKGKEVIRTLEKSGVITKDEKDESRYIATSMGNICVLKNDGATLYSTRDIAAAIDRIERFKPNKLLYVVSSQQDLYFKQLFEALNMAGYGMLKGENIFEHVNFGMINGMSTRKGKVLFLEDIIEDTRQVMLKKIETSEKIIKDIYRTSEILAVGALIVQDFKAKRINNYEFNIKACTEIRGNTGPYLQYVHCRLFSIEQMNLNVWNFAERTMEELSDECVARLDNKLVEIVFMLIKYSQVLDKCMENYEPSTLLTYMFKLCKKINGIVGEFRVMNVERSLAIARLMFYRSARIVVGNALRVLGITPLEQM